MSNRTKLYKYNRKIGMSLINAAIASGYPRSLVDKHRKNLPVPTTNGSTTDFLSLFEQKQMTDVKKVEFVLEGLKAEKTISVESDEMTDNGKKIWVPVTVPDWVARHKFLETMLKLCKQLEKVDATTNNNLFVTSPEFANQLRLARERATEQMKAEYLKPREKKDGTVDAEFTTSPTEPRKKFRPQTLAEAMA